MGKKEKKLVDSQDYEVSRAYAVYVGILATGFVIAGIEGIFRHEMWIPSGICFMFLVIVVTLDKKLQKRMGFTY